MGWGSGVVVFDKIAAKVLTEDLDRKGILETVIDALEDGDWDTQSDSDYYDHPLVQEVLKERHPNWFREE